MGKSYAGLASNLNIDLPYKDLMGADIRRMNCAYFDRPDDFDNYSLGDLLVSDMVIAYDGMLRRLYADIGLEYAYSAPRCLRMTIGATVAALYETRILDYHGVDRSVFGPLRKTDRNRSWKCGQRSDRRASTGSPEKTRRVAMPLRRSWARCWGAMPITPARYTFAAPARSSITTSPGLTVRRCRHCPWASVDRLKRTT